MEYKKYLESVNGVSNIENKEVRFLVANIRTVEVKDGAKKGENYSFIVIKAKMKDGTFEFVDRSLWPIELQALVAATSCVEFEVAKTVVNNALVGATARTLEFDVKLGVELKDPATDQIYTVGGEDPDPDDDRESVHYHVVESMCLSPTGLASAVEDTQFYKAIQRKVVEAQLMKKLGL